MSASGIKSKPVYAPLRADARGRYHLMLGLGTGADALLRVLAELKETSPDALHRTTVLFAVGATPSVAAGAPGSAGAATSAANAAPGSVGAATSAANAAPRSVGAATSAADAAPRSVGAATSAADAAPAAATASDSTALGTVDEVERLRRSGPSALRTYDDAAALLAEFRAVLDECLMGTRVYVAGPESFIGPALRIALDFNLNKDEIRAEALGTLSRRVYCVHCQATTDGVRTNIAQCAGCNRWLLVRDHYSRRLAAYMGVMVDAEAPGELPEIREVFA